MKLSNILFGFIIFAPICFFLSHGWSSAPEADQFPIIKQIEWGKIIVSHKGHEQQFRDCKIWPQKAKEWNWQETGTHHSPGIQPADIEEFINNVDVVILSRGMDLDLQIPQSTIDYVTKQNKECFVGETKEMVARYNELVKEGKKVGALFHSTC